VWQLMSTRSKNELLTSVEMVLKVYFTCRAPATCL
jgi:hypothetical protein